MCGRSFRPVRQAISTAVRALIAKDPSLARSHYDYRKPLYFAVRENRIDVVRFLLEHDRNPLDLWVDDDPIEIARDRGYTEMEQLLTHTLDTKFNASPKGEPVALALREHDLKQMRELLDAQPALVGKGDKRSNQPIHWATMTRQLDAIDELLRRGADINAQRMDGARPIHLTNGDYFYRGWRDVPRNWPVTRRTSHGPPEGARRVHRFADCVSHRRYRPRARIAPTGSVAGKQDWRARGLLPRRRRRRCQMPPRSGAWTSCSCCSITAPTPICPKSRYAPKGKALYSAVFHGHYEIAKLLLERGAFPNPPVESSGDALWVSQERRPDKRMEQLLLSYGAKPTKGHTGEDWPHARAQLAAHLAAPRGGAQGRCAGGEETARGWRRPDRA